MAADTLQRRTLGVSADAEERGIPAAAIAGVYEAHFRYVWRCLRSLGVRDDALDDAVQDVFIVVQRKLQSFDGKAQLRTWLYGIALRVARRYRARAAKEARKLAVNASPSDRECAEEGDPLSAEMVSSSSDSEQDLEKSERLALARRALSLLEDSKREAFVLAYVEQMSAKEIAQVTGLPVNTVYSRIRAARLAFDTQIARMQPTSRRRPR